MQSMSKDIDKRMVKNQAGVKIKNPNGKGTREQEGIKINKS